MMAKKLLSMLVPCGDVQKDIRDCVESLLAGGEDLEILLVDIGAQNSAGAVLKELKEKYPNIIRTMRQPTGTRGSAVMSGLQMASGNYFKVVDPEHRLNETVLARVMELLRESEEKFDLLICNSVLEKPDEKRKKVAHYRRELPKEQVFGWDEFGRFAKGDYIWMSSCIYRTQMLLDEGLEIPQNINCIETLYETLPMQWVKKMYYLDGELDHCYIRWEDPKREEEIRVNSAVQRLRIAQMLLDQLNMNNEDTPKRNRYLYNCFERITAETSVLLVKSSKPELRVKRDWFWQDLYEKDAKLCEKLRSDPVIRRILGTSQWGCQWALMQQAKRQKQMRP